MTAPRFGSPSFCTKDQHSTFANFAIRCGIKPWCILVLSFICICALANARQQRLPQAGRERVLPQTISSSAFIADLGVNVHLNFSGTPYTNVSAVETAMTYLGLDTMRDMGGQQAPVYGTL